MAGPTHSLRLTAAALCAGVAVYLAAGEVLPARWAEAGAAVTPAVTTSPTTPPPTTTPAETPLPSPTPLPTAAAGHGLTPADTSTPLPSPTPTVVPTTTPVPYRPVTHISLPRIGLDSDVVVSPLLENGDDVTWEVPPFKAGHAEGTAGAGAPGNAVLFGHVTSRNAGNVFAHLDAARVGDDLLVASADQRFVYRVNEIVTVPRTAGEIMDPTELPTMSLVTCTGQWNPVIWDYTHRLVVRAELIPAPNGP